MPRLSVNSINLNYELEGNGSVVVFINGLTMDVNGWYFQVQEFSKRHRVTIVLCVSTWKIQASLNRPWMFYGQS